MACRHITCSLMLHQLEHPLFRVVCLHQKKVWRFVIVILLKRTYTYFFERNSSSSYFLSCQALDETTDTTLIICLLNMTQQGFSLGWLPSNLSVMHDKTPRISFCFLARKSLPLAEKILHFYTNTLFSALKHVRRDGNWWDFDWLIKNFSYMRMNLNSFAYEQPL